MLTRARPRGRPGTGSKGGGVRAAPQSIWGLLPPRFDSRAKVMAPCQKREAAPLFLPEIRTRLSALLHCGSGR